MRKIINSTRGASAVEFALVLPLLLVILFGIIEFGAILYNQAVITNASREGARYAATFYVNPANATSARPTCSDIQNYVTTYVNTYFINFGTSPAFGTGNISCPNGTPYYNNSGTLAGYVDSIQIQYQYNFLFFGGVLQVMGGSISPSLTLTAQTAMRDENQN